MPKKAALIFTAILFSVVIIYFAAVEKVGEKEVTTPQQTAFAVLTDITELDTDNDGLKDWEEELWGSDPLNEDTDGDGTRDNDEVTSGRNPTVAGPDDLLSEDTVFFDNTKSIQEEDSLTSSLSKELFSDYLELKKSDNLNSISEQELINRLINSSTDSVEFNKYTISNFKIISDGNESISAYKKTITNIFNDFSKVTENELVVMYTAIEIGDVTEFQKLDYSVVIYEDAVRKLLEVEVPKTARFIHTDLLNGINYFIEVIKGMRGVVENPLAAITSVNSYTDAESYLSNVFLELNAYFIDKGVTE